MGQRRQPHVSVVVGVVVPVHTATHAPCPPPLCVSASTVPGRLGQGRTPAQLVQGPWVVGVHLGQRPDVARLGVHHSLFQGDLPPTHSDPRRGVSAGGVGRARRPLRIVATHCLVSLAQQLQAVEAHIEVVSPRRHKHKLEYAAAWEQWRLVLLLGKAHRGSGRPRLWGSRPRRLSLLRPERRSSGPRLRGRRCDGLCARTGWGVGAASRARAALTWLAHEPRPAAVAGLPKSRFRHRLLRRPLPCAAPPPRAPWGYPAPARSVCPPAAQPRLAGRS